MSEKPEVRKGDWVTWLHRKGARCLGRVVDVDGREVTVGSGTGVGRVYEQGVLRRMTDEATETAR